MAFTAWKTWASGDTLTAADMNTYQRDNGKWMTHDPTDGAPMCRVYSSVTQSIPTTTETALEHDTERYDVGGMHSTSSNTARITIPTGGGGKYLVGGHFELSVNSTGQRSAIIDRNAVTTVARQQYDSTSSLRTQFSICTIYNMSGGDYFRLVAYQNTGGAENVVASSNWSPEFWAIWLGE